MAFMPENSPLVVLSFLGASFLLAVGLISLIAAAVFRRPKVFKFALAGIAGVVVLYSTTLLLCSWTSRDQVLALGPGPAGDFVSSPSRSLYPSLWLWDGIGFNR